jgi:putative hemolysin
MYSDLKAQRREEPFPDQILSQLGVRVDVAEQDLARVPAKGPVLAVANHPFGLIEGAALASVLPRVRPDVKILANRLLFEFEELHDCVIPVDPFGTREAVRSNLRGLRQALDWLSSGHLLVIFPAGEVSHFDPRQAAVLDPAWSRTVAWLLRQTRAAALPLYFSGANSALFHLAGLVHPRLRTALLPHELLNKQGGRIELRAGNAIPSRRLLSIADDAEMTLYLRRRTYWLERRAAPKTRPARSLAPLSPAVPPTWLAQEISEIAPSRLLVENGAWQVWLTTKSASPFLVREIARLREATFRAAGEGSGAPLDTDQFDDHYQQLILWNAECREIAGGYRLCGADTPGQRLYTQQLFRYGRPFLDTLGPALELGRSFVRPEYQKGYQPLFLLWRGIGEFIARNPQYGTLFGPVSVSNEYLPASRSLIVQSLHRHAFAAETAPLVRARNPFRAAPWPVAPMVESMDDLDMFIADLEPDGKGLPVLVRQYLKLGGRFAAFHVDHSFGRTLDGLIIVNLQTVEPKLLERYLGEVGARAVLRSIPTAA